MPDLIISDEKMAGEQFGRPPLYLQYYLDEQEQRLSHGPVVKPPGMMQARVVERRGNLIVLDFTAMPTSGPKPRHRSTGFGHLCRSGWDLVIILLLLGTAIACAAALVH